MQGVKGESWRLPSNCDTSLVKMHSAFELAGRSASLRCSIARRQLRRLAGYADMAWVQLIFFLAHSIIEHVASTVAWS